jgi:hypothetical protein
MPTLLLTDERDSTRVISRRSRARELLATWFRAWSLDTAIASGHVPTRPVRFRCGRTG